MRATTTILAILLVACGNNGGGNEDTSTDTLPDVTDTAGDTSTDSTPDTVEDTPVDTTVDTTPDTAEDTAPDTAVDTALDTLADTPADTSTDEAVEEEAPECTLDDDCDNGAFCDGEETCSAEGTCQAGTLVACDDTDPCTTDRCNEDDDECAFDPTDSDGDGYAAATGPGGDTCPGTDCDDTNNAIFPGALSVACSDADHDCNGNPDNDNDGDGHVDITCTDGEDCNDGDPAFWSGCWYDPATGYFWPNPMVGISCEDLSLAGHSDWRDPTIDEYRSLFRGCSPLEPGGSCGITTSCSDMSCWTDTCDSVCSGYDCFWDPALGDDCSCGFIVFGTVWKVFFMPDALWPGFGTADMGCGTATCIRTP